MFNWRLPQRAGRHDLAEGALDLSPHGQILHLRRPASAIKRDAVASRLGRFSDGRMPFVGILLDLGGAEYYFSSADLGALVASTAAWARGKVAPCAIVLTGKSAGQLQALLDITRLGTLQHLRIVDSVDAGRSHITAYLDQHPL